MISSTSRMFSALLPLLAVFALSSCELAYHEFSAERQPGCSPWKVGCRPTIDVAGEGPIQTTWYDVHRSQMVIAAEHAPYRQCGTLALGCQFVIMFDALDQQYFQPL